MNEKIGAARAKLALTMAPETLHHGAHYQVALLFGGRTVKVVRSARVFESTAEVAQACSAVSKVLDELGREKRRVLIDSREAKAMASPEIERAFAKPRARMVAGFARVAVLLASAAGQLQVGRLQREDSTLSAVRTFVDEEKALAYLEAPLEGGEG